MNSVPPIATKLILKTITYRHLHRKDIQQPFICPANQSPPVKEDTLRRLPETKIFRFLRIHSQSRMATTSKQLLIEVEAGL